MERRFYRTRVYLRRVRLASVFGLLIFGVPSNQALAIGNVLVPGDDGSSSSLPSTDADPMMGGALLPTSPSIEMPSQMPSQPATAPQMSLPLSTPNSLPAPPLPNIGGGSSFSAASYAVPNPYTVPQMQIPTKIVKMPQQADYDSSLSTLLPKSIGVSIEDAQWGADDLAAVNRSLSIPVEQVAKNCQIAFSGTLTSSTGGYMFDTGASQNQATLHFDGTPRSMNLMTKALCNTIPLPPNAGTVLQVGDKYVVSMGSSDCPPPPSGAQSMVVQYSGNGKSQCNYQ
jgi:hypothetical protein